MSNSESGGEQIETPCCDGLNHGKIEQISKTDLEENRFVPESTNSVSDTPEIELCGENHEENVEDKTIEGAISVVDENNGLAEKLPYPVVDYEKLGKEMLEKLKVELREPRNRSRSSSCNSFGELDTREKEKNSPEKPDEPAVESLAVGTQPELLKTTMPGHIVQATPEDIEIELRLYPLLTQHSVHDMNIPISYVTKERRKAFKRIIREHNLICIPFGRMQERKYNIRKKPDLIKSQLLAYEAKLARQRQREIEQLQKQQELERSSGKRVTKVNGGCQFDCEKDLTGAAANDAHLSKKAKKRLKTERIKQKREERLNRPKLPKVIEKRDSEAQTAPEGYWVCPWCGNDIAPEVLLGHETVCKRLHQSTGPKRRRKSKAPKTDAQQQNASRKQAQMVKELDSVIDNDVEAVTKALRSFCSLANCVEESTGKCKGCKASFCCSHKPKLEHQCMQPGVKPNLKPLEVIQMVSQQERQFMLRYAMRQQILALKDKRR